MAICRQRRDAINPVQSAAITPFMHFTCPLLDIEKKVLRGQPAWPVERTLLTSDMLNAQMTSK